MTSLFGSQRKNEWYFVYKLQISMILYISSFS